MTEWKDVTGYEGIYEASTDGQIRTKEGKTTYTEKHGIRKWKSRVLKQKVGKDKCHRVSLWKEGKEKTWLVHRLIALTFLEKPINKDYVNHMDGNRSNNLLENLEWCNHTENNNHAFDNDLMTTNKKIVLRNKITNELFYFRSQSKASLYLGYSDKYISSQLLKGKFEIDDYEIFRKY